MFRVNFLASMSRALRFASAKYLWASSTMSTQFLRVPRVLDEIQVREDCRRLYLANLEVLVSFCPRLPRGNRRALQRVIILPPLAAYFVYRLSSFFPRRTKGKSK